VNVKQARLQERMYNADIIGFHERIEKTACEAIRYGFEQLIETFSHIKEMYGQLPTVIFFPDTGARPLAGTLYPLLRHVYEGAHQPLPARVFVKTYSKAEGDHSGVIDEFRSQIDLLRRQRMALVSEREELLRSLRRRSCTEGEKEGKSLLIHQLRFQILECMKKEQKLIQLQGRFEKKEHEDILRDRLKRALDVSSSGPILIVDDVASKVRTFSSFQKSLFDLGRTDDAYYFAFMATRDFSINTKRIPAERCSAGVAFPREDGKLPIISVRHVLSDQDLPKREWQELFLHGFPFQMESAALIGVEKDQNSLNPYSVRSAHRDPVRSQEMYARYRKMGEEALKKIRQSAEGD